jgi:hypothetical protein
LHPELSIVVSKPKDALVKPPDFCGPRTVALFAAIAALDQQRLRFLQDGRNEFAKMCDQNIDTLKSVIEEKGYHA